MRDHRGRRRRRATRIAALALSAALAGPAAAEEDAAAARPCSCEGPDGRHPVGSLVCLRVGETERLARCERVLNNTSWRILREDCPLASPAAPQGRAVTPAPAART